MIKIFLQKTQKQKNGFEIYYKKVIFFDLIKIFT